MFSWLFRSSRRKKLLAEPMPAAWLEIIERNVGHYRLLPEPLQKRLLDAARIVASERSWVGCKGLAIGDEHKVTIAAQASLLLLGVEGYYFEKLPSILVYPGNYKRPHRVGERGFIEAEETELLGESWARGSIVLSWPASLAGGRDPRDGQSLVLHEFAHHLDCLDGEAAGHPPQPTREAAERWDGVIDLEYGKLLRALDGGEATLLDPYAGESKAEFFSVSTEVFYERPVELRERHPALYELLRDYFRVDPAEWFAGSRQPLGEGRRERASRRAAAPQDTEEDGDFHDERPPLERAEEYFTRGWDALRDGRYEEAEVDFSEVVRRKPKDVEALVHLAECRLRLGRVRTALDNAKRAVAMDPDDIEAIRMRGMCRVADGQYDAGLRDLNQSLEQKTDDGDAHFYRGVALAEMEHWQQAIRDFTAAIAADRYDAEAWAERSRCQEALGDSAAAERDWKMALELDPSLREEE